MFTCVDKSLLKVLGPTEIHGELVAPRLPLVAPSQCLDDLDEARVEAYGALTALAAKRLAGAPRPAPRPERRRDCPTPTPPLFGVLR